MSPGNQRSVGRVNRPVALFRRYIGIDYSGAKTPTVSLKGLRVYLATRVSAPVEVSPPPSPRKYWSRRGVSEWLVALLSDGIPTLVGIDHGFSFPRNYFESHGLSQSWPEFLDDFQRHWPTDEDHIRVESVRNRASGKRRSGGAGWRRLTERRARTVKQVSPKSVFHFDVPGSVAKSTHAGLPWLRYLRRELQGTVHFWPFDGWQVPRARSAIAEVYPSLWSDSFRRDGRTDDQHDAYAVAAWMQAHDLDGSLLRFLNPSLAPEERALAEIEGWILGVE